MVWEILGIVWGDVWFDFLLSFKNLMFDWMVFMLCGSYDVEVGICIGSK